MLARDIDPIRSPLESRIIRDLSIVSPDTLVNDAIAQMIDTQSGNSASESGGESVACSVVVENERVLGLVTERDVLRLIAQGKSLNTLMMRQIMTPSAIALRESDIAHATIKQMALLENAARQLRHQHL